MRINRRRHCQQLKRDRAGITWIEVLVVLGILLLVVAFCLPAVRVAREPARRMQCKNNLKQIGLGLHNYHDTHQSYPPGYLINPDGPYLGWSWGLFVAPYVDSITTVDFPKGLHANLDRINSARGSVFCCPSAGETVPLEHALIVTADVADGVVTPGDVDIPLRFPRSHLFGVAGYLRAEAGGIDREHSEVIDPKGTFMNRGSLGQIGNACSSAHRYCDPQNFQGVFAQNSGTKQQDIKDGTSNVFMVGERYMPGLTTAATVGHGTWIAATDCSTSTGLANVLGDTSVPLNAGHLGIRPTTGFGSHHIGGSHFLLADGSVKFISDKIGIGLYRDLSTINDGRRVSGF